MILSPPPLTLYAAQVEDYRRLAKFMHFEPFMHRHLDWRAPLEWLGSQPFLLAEQEGNLVGAFACPPDPPEPVWIRLFASDRTGLSYTWRTLYEAAQAQLRQTGSASMVAIALQDWFEPLLIDSGFTTQQRIVLLEWESPLPAPRPIPPHIHLRRMRFTDLPTVQILDEAAFSPLWCNSLTALTLAFEQSAHATVAETDDGEIIGYQISTAAPLSAHLARLAVHPSQQRQNIAWALVADMLEELKGRGAWRITVNTQSDNASSLALYDALGFIRTGEELPVYQSP
jgi:ribosomal protein S18 acetylase RimI-like enzyme